MDEKTLRLEIQKLIEKFERAKTEGKYKSYNEENTKKDFILPLFRALGWNVEDSEEVKAEEKVSKKRVDYAFRINGVVKFYLEAKSFKESISDPKYAKQAIEYAWNKSVPWAILSNFEGIRVFNAEWKWDDKQPMRNQFLDLRYTDFLESCFKYLTWLSRESFDLGVLDKQATILSKKVKKLPIDKQLLADFTDYRKILSKDILKNNPKMDLSQDDLDEVVQRILDRIIFIRTCEDKEIESEKLESEIRMHGDKEGQLYKELIKKYREYDNGYNSKLFLEHLCEKVVISNDVLIEVISGTYRSKYLDIQYDFSAINADVLGNIYEQYLGNILKTTPKRAKITNGKAHRKEQGIYYTPTKIVDYIVRNSISEKLKERKIKVDELKILDPACGSGSFLLKAFDIICEHSIKKEGKTLQARFEDISSGKLLKRKTELLKNCIFGVDLDIQAVEITQLNLLLKLAERRQRLPTLQENIKCGNSIIDDFELVGEKAFKWEEQFKEIMQRGGFDVIIGNPPYGAELNEKEREYISNKYKFSSSYKNTALIFIEKALDLLNKKGYFGMIVPKSIAFSQLWQPGRELIKEHLIKVVDVSKAFEEVLLEQVIIILNKSIKPKTYIIQDILSKDTIDVDKKYIDSTDSIILHGDRNDFEIFKTMNSSLKHLSEITKTSRGLPFQKYLVKEKTKYPMIKGKTISRYNYYLSNEYLPDITVEQNKNKVSFLQQPKIISQRIVAHVTKPKDHIIIMSALDKKGLINVDTVENTVVTDDTYSLEFVLCLLNSKLISWYAYRYIFSKAIRTMDFDDYYVGKIPLPKTKIRNEIFIEYANKMISFINRLNEIGGKQTDERARIEEQIKKTDKEIDDLIYKLYGLNETQIEIVKNSF